MAPLMSKLGTTVHGMSLQTNADDTKMHKACRRTMWLLGLGAQLFFGYVLVLGICGVLDPDYTMTHTLTNTILVGVWYVLVGLFFMACLSLALQMSFYWAWGIGWKDWCVGRAMFWMWGPVDEDNVQFDLEQDGEASLKKEQVFEDFEEVKVVSAQPKPHPDMAAPVASPKSIMTRSIPYVPTEALKRARRAQPGSAQIRVELPQTATSAPHVKLYETKSKAIAALYDYKFGELSNFCTFDPKTNTIVAFAAKATIPSPTSLRQAGLEVLWLPMQFQIKQLQN